MARHHLDYPGYSSPSDESSVDNPEDENDDERYETHTTAAQVRRGKDIQGIPWEYYVPREEQRKYRLGDYENYRSVPNSGEASGQVCKIAKKGAPLYDFRHNSRSVKSPILHFQLRNLVWATTNHDVYLASRYFVQHWSSLTQMKHTVLDVIGHVVPSENRPGNLMEGFTKTKISTLAIKDGLLILGGCQGELICKYLHRPEISFCFKITYYNDATINCAEIYTDPSGSVHFTGSSNDCGVRDFDTERCQLTRHLQYPWPVDHTSLSPDRRLLVVVGDNPDGISFIIALQTLMTLPGHLDFSFASEWHPAGFTFATGNQDKTCRIWDVRKLPESVAVLKGNMEAIQSVRYTSDNRFMAMAEPADYVHVYDMNCGVSICVEYGGTFGGSLLEYGHRRNYAYLDSLTCYPNLTPQGNPGLGSSIATILKARAEGNSKSDDIPSSSYTRSLERSYSLEAPDCKLCSSQNFHLASRMSHVKASAFLRSCDGPVKRLKSELKLQGIACIIADRVMK
ncbi:hypothetical protein V6N13_016330 [Hibiscus sabdariffa]|uniref:Uncharacterized protein n=1 Tax=Hibiscus sabdariffa TaxID=183260 RepID=A0ABR2BH36_9ROSI